MNNLSLAIRYLILFYWTRWMTGTALAVWVYHQKPRRCNGLNDTWAYLWPVFKYGNQWVREHIVDLAWFNCQFW